MLKFHKNQMGYHVIMTSFQFSPNNCPYLKFFESTNCVLGTNTPQHNGHLMIKMKVTLTDDEGHRGRSKVIKMN